MSGQVKKLRLSTSKRESVVNTIKSLYDDGEALEQKKNVSHRSSVVFEVKDQQCIAHIKMQVICFPVQQSFPQSSIARY